MSENDITITATEFKAKCLELFKRLEQGKLDRVTVTRRGKPVASVGPPIQAQRGRLKDAYGFMRGGIRLAPDYDPFEQVVEESDDPFIGKASDSDAA